MFSGRVEGATAAASAADVPIGISATVEQHLYAFECSFPCSQLQGRAFLVARPANGVRVSTVLQKHTGQLIVTVTGNIKISAAHEENLCHQIVVAVEDSKVQRRAAFLHL